MLCSEKHLKRGGGGMISRRAIPSPSTFDKGKKVFFKGPFDTRKKKDNNIRENSHPLIGWLILL